MRPSGVDAGFRSRVFIRRQVVVARFGLNAQNAPCRPAGAPSPTVSQVLPDLVFSPAATITGEEYLGLIDMNRERLSYYFPSTSRGVADIVKADRALREKSRLERKHLLVFRGLRLPPSNVLVGIMSLRLHRNGNKGGLTCFIDKAYEGRGYMYRSLRQFLVSIRRSSGLTAVFAYVDPANTRIVKILEGLGFAQVPNRSVDFQSGPGTMLRLEYYELVLEHNHGKSLIRRLA